MEVNDRGSKKWTAMMMPEHHQLLDKMWKQQEYKQKPVLDEQQKEEINMKLHIAIRDDLYVIINYFKDHSCENVRGKLKTINSMNGYLLLNNEVNIELNNILDVQID